MCYGFLRFRSAKIDSIYILRTSLTLLNVKDSSSYLREQDISSFVRGPWRGKMGTGICLCLHWENGTWVTGNGNHKRKTRNGKQYFRFRKSRKRNQRAALTTRSVSWNAFSALVSQLYSFTVVKSCDWACANYREATKQEEAVIKRSDHNRKNCHY